MKTSNAVAAKTGSPFVQIPCSLCGGKDHQEIYPSYYPPDISRAELLQIYKSSSDHKLWDKLVACRDCGLVFLNPRVNDEIVLQSYSDAEDPAFISQNEWRISTFRKSLTDVLNRTGLKAAPSTRALDIGCAGGAFPKAASDLGLSVVGIEPSKWLCQYGRKTYGLDLRQGTLEDQDFSPGTFDLVTLWDVIEHVSDPIALLTKARTLLKSEGTLVLNYPNYASLPCRLLGRRWPFLLSVHLYYFTPKTMRSMLEKAGFEPVRSSRHWQTIELGYAFKRAAAYFPFLNGLTNWLSRSALGKIPFTYYLGQTNLICRRNDR